MPAGHKVRPARKKGWLQTLAHHMVGECEPPAGGEENRALSADGAPKLASVGRRDADTQRSSALVAALELCEAGDWNGIRQLRDWNGGRLKVTSIACSATPSWRNGHSNPHSTTFGGMQEPIAPPTSIPTIGCSAGCGKLPRAIGRKRSIRHI
ncbi:MAG: hypothetical protein U1E17_22705 [Geminicoccaceae bacterium]